MLEQIKTVVVNDTLVANIINHLKIDLSKLIVYNPYENDVEGFRPAWCYAHGELEDFLGHDCFNFHTVDNTNSTFDKQRLDIFHEGIYECKTEDGQECLFFLWEVEVTRKGLCVFKHDTSSVQYANECFTNRVPNI